jgi:hypothetical protein
LFNSELDERDYQVVSYAKNPPIKSEKSAGLNMDINYKKKFGDLSLAINQSFFITKIEQPLVGSRQFGMIVYYTEAKPIVTRGFESWVLISYKGLEAYLGYTLTDAQKKYDAGNPYLELSARNKFASVISYEFTPRWRACLEAAFTGKQYLENGGIAPAYPFFAGMLRHDIGRFSFVLNCENILDYRQSKKETILIPPQTNPRFKQLWAPIDGRVINLSVRVKF